MQLAGSTLQLAAYDLGRFLSCRHCTALDMEVANGDRPEPHSSDPFLKMLVGHRLPARVGCQGRQKEKVVESRRTTPSTPSTPLIHSRVEERRGGRARSCRAYQLPLFRVGVCLK